VVSGGVGWGMPEMIQQAFFHNMPLAFATALTDPVDLYVPLNRELQSLLYWWTPDTKFTLDNPAQVLFPPNSPSQYQQNIFKTQKENTRLTNWMAKGLDLAADRAVALASALSISDQELSAILVQHLSAPTPDAWQTACDWLRSTSGWRDWLPNETACSAGKGIVDSTGNFVQQRSLAVGCSTCPVGTFSTDQDTTRACVPCAPGYHQPLPGESVCLPCDVGTKSAAAGAMECTLCPLGTFANATAMTSCYQCGLADQVEKWTTSKAVISQGAETWIQIQGASSEDFCGCVAGTWLDNGRCEECIEGSECPGSNQILLLPGFFSTPEAPGMVFRCFGDAKRCPGGVPGSCAVGRDTSSVACSACQTGLRSADDGVCEACAGGDYVMIVVVGVMAAAGITLLYVVLMNEGQKSRQPGSLLLAALGMGQMVTVVQQLTVIQQFKIEWGEPFSSLLASMELLAFDLDMISISCVAPMSPVMKFTMRTLLVLLFFAVAGVVHVAYVAFKGGGGLRLSLLARTIGTLFMVFFISLCSSLLAPFRCNWHPNGLGTVQAYNEVFCNGKDEHLEMELVGGAACLLPITFLAICVWVIFYQLPKRLEAADVQFIRSCSFLFVRFRPGAEVFSVIFLLRNALVVLCPLLPSPSGKVLCMNLLLYGTLVATAYCKPWRAPAANFLDMLLVIGMLVILDMGSLFVEEVDASTTMAICMLFSCLMLFAIIGAILYGVAKHFILKYRKAFRFFLCHQKVAAGSLSRLLKMELQKRGSRFKTFVDCDDLNDLTRLFSYVGQDTETLVVLATPDILTRKWCVGEMCTARVQRVHSVFLTFPGFVKPDKAFIESYSSIVPDVTELANYNIGLTEVEETLQWVNSLQTVEVPALLTLDSVDRIVSELTNTFRTKSTNQALEPDCIILADLDNIESASTAYVLLGLLVPMLVGAGMPVVLQKEEPLPRSAKAVLMICSEGCFRSPDVASSLLQILAVPSCSILPIIAEDGFRFPSQAYYDDLVQNPQLADLDLEQYVRIIKAVFQEIAVVFSPQNYSSTQEDLELRAKQVAWRLQSGALKSLASKLTKPKAANAVKDKETNAEHDKETNNEADLKEKWTDVGESSEGSIDGLRIETEIF